VDIEVTEWDLINLLKQLEVGTDELYYDIVFNEEKKRDLFLAAPIEALSLSIRTSNCLKKAGITTIGQLTEINAQGLKCNPAFGNKSLNELNEILEMLGFSLKSE
jgi:DNA-directed RNA polymerase subunit alpha